MESPTQNPALLTQHNLSAAASDDLKPVFEKLCAKRWSLAQSTAKERTAKLVRLREVILERRDELYQAFRDDFKKAPAEVDVTEIFPTLSEISHTIRHLKKWMKPKKVKSPLALFGTQSQIRFEAKGLVLILAPWNYPFNLSINPLVAAVAAGNCVILKPSSKVPNTSRVLKSLLAQVFPEDEVAVIQGSSAVSDLLLEFPFDHILFTGSPKIGKTVMAAAAKNLTPVTLELGGKSPVIVDETADVKKAAERIVWGKLINAGQTCVAPDYLLIAQSKRDEFIREAKKAVSARYGATDEAREASQDFCRQVSAAHREGLKKILDLSVKQGAKIEMGGLTGSDSRYLAPTLLSNVTSETEIMKDEIFGPILPILTFTDLNDALRLVRSKDKPLALYFFSSNRASIEKVLTSTTAGGTCINSLILHLANPDLPFGGVGNSGMGSYHGLHGFRTFSHERSVVTQGRLDILQLFYPPYTSRTRRIIGLATRFLSRF